MFLLNCDTCDRGYHMQCLQPPAEDKPKSAWRCSFCLDHHETIISIEEPLIVKSGRKKSSLKNQRYIINKIHIYILLLLLLFINKYNYRLFALHQYVTYQILWYSTITIIHNQDIVLNTSK